MINWYNFIHSGKGLSMQASLLSNDSEDDALVKSEYLRLKNYLLSGFEAILKAKKNTEIIVGSSEPVYVGDNLKSAQSASIDLYRNDKAIYESVCKLLKDDTDIKEKFSGQIFEFTRFSIKKIIVPEFDINAKEKQAASRFNYQTNVYLNLEPPVSIIRKMFCCG